MMYQKYSRFVVLDIPNFWIFVPLFLGLMNYLSVHFEKYYYLLVALAKLENTSTTIMFHNKNFKKS